MTGSRSAASMFSPIEVDVVLSAHAAVLECAVVGRVDAQGLTRTLVYVVPRAGNVTGEALAAGLKAWVKGKLAPHKYPGDILFVEDLPETATGNRQDPAFQAAWIGAGLKLPLVAAMPANIAPARTQHMDID